MILVFNLVVIVLLGIGTYQSQLRRATVHWGRAIAGLAHIRREIDEAKASDPEEAAELLGRSVHQRGFQDAITPPWLTRLTLLHWPIWVATYIWGFFTLPWYVALLWPVAFTIAKRILAAMLPRPDSDFYREQLVASLEARLEHFRRAGDDMRFAAAQHMIDLLHQNGQNV